jgi:hypothetical protein
MCGFTVWGLQFLILTLLIAVAFDLYAYATGLTSASGLVDAASAGAVALILLVTYRGAGRGETYARTVALVVALAMLGLFGLMLAEDGLPKQSSWLLGPVGALLAVLGLCFDLAFKRR